MKARKRWKISLRNGENDMFKKEIKNFTSADFEYEMTYGEFLRHFKRKMNKKRKRNE